MFVSESGVGADAEGCFLHPRDVTVSANGVVHVLDSSRQAVLQFAWTTDTNLPGATAQGVDKKWHNQTVAVQAKDLSGNESEVTTKASADLRVE